MSKLVLSIVFLSLLGCAKTLHIGPDPVGGRMTFDQQGNAETLPADQIEIGPTLPNRVTNSGWSCSAAKVGRDVVLRSHFNGVGQFEITLGAGGVISHLRDVAGGM